MAHIPNQAIFWRVENIMQRNGQLHRTQVRTEMTASL